MPPGTVLLHYSNPIIPALKSDLDQGHHLLLSSLVPSIFCSPIFSLLAGPAALPAGWILPFDILGIQF